MLQKIRVDEACVLLASTDRKITDIALSCGFGDMKFFYGTFKKLTGMTPGEYRQRNSPPPKKFSHKKARFAKREARLFPYRQPLACRNSS